MHIKRFEADTLEAALEDVRRTLGPDALILSSRTLARGRGAFGLFARPRVEVQAALERGSSQPATGGDGRESGRLADRLAEGLAALERREAFEEEVRRELRSLRGELALTRRSRSEGVDERVEDELEGLGLDARHAVAVAERWRRARDEGDARSLDAVLAAQIESRLAVPRFERSNRIRVLVGAPGVGKTTSAAKLAARSDEGEREVALATLDGYRIGARDQLERFASLLDAPFCELDHAGDVAGLARRYRDHAILVDTAGRSPGDERFVRSLTELRDVLRGEGTIELVVDATARDEVARAQLARFAPLAPDRLILTKLDECTTLAPVVNWLLDDETPPVCWLGTGQRVPEDFEVADPVRFVEALRRDAA